MGGFFKIYRDIFNHEIFKHELDFRLFMLILGQAVFHEDGATMQGVKIKRGQWIRSYRLLVKDLEYKEKRGYKQYGLATIKRAVERLIKFDLITVNETENGTLFTVVNYEKYQGVSDNEVQDNGTPNGTLPERNRNKNKNVKNEKKKDNNRRQQKKPVYDEHSPYMKMAHYLRDRILAWKPNARMPKDFQGWADEFRKLHEIDGRSKAEIKAVIDWATQHHFWQTNILSAKKLRDKFDMLQGQMENQSNPKVINHPAFEDRRRKDEEVERKRLEQRDRQIAVQRFIDAGFNPMTHGDLLDEWLQAGAKIEHLKELEKRQYGS